MRWLVDGLNVIGSRPDGWWRDRHAAMVRLVDLLERFVATTGEQVTVVFEQPPSPPISSGLVEVTHAPRAHRNAADEEIVRRLEDDPKPGEVRVVTSDRALADQAGPRARPWSPPRRSGRGSRRSEPAASQRRWVTPAYRSSG